MFNTVDGQRLIKYSVIAVIVLIAFLAVQVLYTLRLTSNVGENQPAMRTITVNGLGEVFAKPDIATFTFGATEKAKDVGSAQKIVTDKVNKGIELVKAAGVEEKDIKTVSYNIYPHYQYTQSVCTAGYCTPGKETIDGYEVTQTIQVKVRDTSKAGTILGQLGSVQLNNISGLSFTIDDHEAVRAEAKEKAIADARQKAERLAGELGIRLGGVVNYYDNSDYYPLPYAGGYAKELSVSAQDGASVPSLPAGENQIVSNVSITYAIK
ncbi:MAG TPA: SIMPL domain-containing protein [Candidatus Nanoarchaeia archaeon]|nr:SIMPL domain-containing protein [Candidatus Nanoarchaeia archaeon]